MSGNYRRGGTFHSCEVRRSDVHGSGVFATRGIAKGERIIEYLGELIDKDEAERRGLEQMERAQAEGGAAVYLFIVNDKLDLDGNFEWNDARLINHSCAPNCETEIDEDERIWVVALRRIAAGEELFFDYNFDLDQYEDHPCRCGSPKCIGYIVGQQYWRKLKRKLGKKEKKKKKSGRNGKKSGGKSTGKGPNGKSKGKALQVK